MTCGPAPQSKPQTCGNGLFNERAPQGCLNCFCFGVTNQCQSSHLFRTKVFKNKKLKNFISIAVCIYLII